MIEETIVRIRPNKHRDAEAVDEAGQHIAALIVGAEPVVFEVAAAVEALALHHRLAFRRGEQPSRLRRRRGRQVEIVGGVRVADRRPDHAAAFLGDQLLHKGIAIVRRRFEVAAKRGFRIGEEHREVGLAVEANVERLVVGDEFREQRDHEQREENPQRPIAAPVGLEIPPAPLVDRRQGDPPQPRHRTERSGRLDVNRQRPDLVGSFDGVCAAGLDVHLKPPASRNRCADRSRCRSDRKSDSR